MGGARAIRRDGAAALDLCYVAAGRVDGFWEEKLQPWDMMAGMLMVEEAGGRVTRFDGRPLGLRADEIVAAGPGCTRDAGRAAGDRENRAGVVKLADTRGLKSWAARAACGFDSHLRHTRSEKGSGLESQHVRQRKT